MRLSRPTAILAAAGVLGGGAATLGLTSAHADPAAAPVAAVNQPVAGGHTVTYTPAKASDEFMIQTSAGPAKVTIAEKSPTQYRVNVMGTTNSGKPTTLPVNFSAGLKVPTGSSRMDGNAGSMVLTSSTATFAFDSAYEKNFFAPYTYAGGWDVNVTTADTSNQVINVGGHPYAIHVQAPTEARYATGAGTPRKVHYVFEVDKARLDNAATANAYFHLAADGKLTLAEGKPLYTSPAYKHHFHEQFAFVAVDVPFNDTQAQLTAAINAHMPKGYDKITSNAKPQLGGTKAPVSVTTIWGLDTAHGAKPGSHGSAFGPGKHTLAEVYIGSSAPKHV